MLDYSTPPKAFPLKGVQPREETQAQGFIDKNPEYDGRGTVVAIIDTGVDPGAVGMQTTTSGDRKLINIIDCTGQGDVLCTTVVEPTVTKDPTTGRETRTLKGLTGRKLIIPDIWPAARDNKYRLGWKDIALLYPEELVEEIKKDRRKKFEVEHHAIISGLQARLSRHESEHGATPKEEKIKVERAEIKNMMDALREQMAAFNEPGLVFDCVVFHDGTMWRAAVDINENGELKDAPLLATYSEEFQYASFGPDSMLNFSVNIYDEGEMLSIVTLSGTHGTHVAGIAAACHPTDPLQHGVAPGAQVVSLKIGDERVKGMETGTGLVRAAIELCRLKCDVANISFGEAVMTPDYGRFIQLLRDEVINKTGCVVVSSAGNSGPALTTVGAPGGPTSGVISVGAYVTSTMMDAMYNLLERNPETPTTWSSRGPTSDGAVGVEVYAPGAAITSLPQYTKAAGTMMNGTSMSSPNVAGCVCLLVSGLKQLNVPYNPYRITAAIRNTSKDIQDPFRVGFIQVSHAFDHLVKVKPLRHNLDVYYTTAFNSRSKDRGLYLRELEETSVAMNYDVKVKPRFFREEEYSENPKKFEYEAHVALVCTKHWISAPEFVMMHSEGRNFLIHVDPTKLPPGLHFAEVIGIDTNQRDAGPLFKIPITVCKPEETVVDTQYGSRPSSVVKFPSMVLVPPEVHRKFVYVPEGANFAEIIVKSKERVGTSTVIVQLTQITPRTTYKINVNDNWLPFSSTTSGVPGEEQRWAKVVNVLPGVVMELAFAHYWSSVGRTEVSIEVVFHGLVLSSAPVATGGIGTASGGDLIWLDAGNTGLARCDLWCTMRREEVAASVVLDTWRKSVRPTEAVVSALKSRDVLPDSRQLHQLALTYSVKVPEGVTGVTPSIRKATGVLYDSFFESFTLQIFDSLKCLKSTQDIYPKSVKLSEGTYTIRAQFVSADLEVLDKLQTVALLLDFSLSKNITLPAYNNLENLIAGSGDFSKRTMIKGQRITFWVGAADASSYPKTSAPGDLLLGKFNLAAGEIKPARLHAAAYVIPSEVKAKEPAPVATTPELPGDATAEPKPEKDEAVAMKDAVRDLEISYLKKITKEADRAALVAKLEAEHGTHLPFLVARLEVAGERVEKAEKEAKEASKVTAEMVEEVEAAAKAVLDKVDDRELAVYLGTKVDMVSGGEAAKEKKKEMDAAKSALVSALLWRARALRLRVVMAKPAPVVPDQVALAIADPATPVDGSKPPLDRWTVEEDPAASGDGMKKFEQSLVEAAKWLGSPPTSDAKYLTLWVWRLRMKGQRGAALRALNKFLGDAKNIEAGGEGSAGAAWRELVELKGEILAELGWEAWSRYEERWRIIRSPPAFAPF
ncbi:tripeptidyl-peptidase II Tpp2 [Irineochytrium annulatum]|nr:tripeptidyl-peptidase II Tpp2 [Irineochytrium annulatum]